MLCLWSGPPGFNCWTSAAPAFQGWSCCWVLILFYLSVESWLWTASSEYGTYRLCEQRRFRRACAFAQSRQNLRCSLIQAVSQEEPSDRKPDPWPLWMAGHAQLKFFMTECSKTQSRLTRPIIVFAVLMYWWVEVLHEDRKTCMFMNHSRI